MAKTLEQRLRERGVEFPEDKALRSILPITSPPTGPERRSTYTPPERIEQRETLEQRLRKRGIEVPEPEPEEPENPSLLGRLGSAASSIGKGTAGSYLSSLGTGVEFLSNPREWVPSLEEIKISLGSPRVLQTDSSGKKTAALKPADEAKLQKLQQERITNARQEYAKNQEIANKWRLPTTTGLRNDAGKLLQSSAEDLTRGKQGLGPVSGLLYEGATAAGQMGADWAASALTGTPVLGLIGARSFGQSADEARQAGANIGQQVGYGALSAGIETGTEKIFGGTSLHKRLMGEGFADSAANFAMDKLAKVTKASPRVASIMKFVGSMAEEGTEEVISEILSPVAQRIAYAPDTPDSTIEERVYAGLVGAISAGILGGAGQVIENRNSKAIDREYKKVIADLPEDSPTLAIVESYKENNANVTNEAKADIINRGRRELGENTFESETDKLLQQTRQTVQPQQNENISNDQLVNEGQTFAKTQNMASETVSPKTNVFGIENVANPTEVKSKVYEYYKDLVSTSETSKPIMNKNTNLPVEVSRATINQTFGADDRFRAAADNDIKIAAMENIVPLIENGDMQVIDAESKPSSKVPYANIAGTVNVNGIPHAVSLEVRRNDTGSKMFVHSIKTDVGQIQLTENKKSGMINNGYENQIDPTAYNILDRIGQVTGTRIRVVPNIASPDGTDPDFANGQYDVKTKTLEISMRSSNPVMVVAKHEITHILQQKSPELYKEYKDYVINTMKENGTYANVYEGMKELYRIKGIEISESEIQDEIVADATETFLTDKTAIENLVKENRTLGQKILDILRDFIKKVDEAVKGVTTGWMGVEQLRTAEKMWVDALNSVAEKETRRASKRAEKAYSLKDDTFSKQIDDWVAGKFKRDDHLIVLNETPKIYQDLGAKNLPITVASNKIDRIINSKGKQKRKYHGLGIETTKQLPEALKNPISILASHDNSFVAITNLFDSKGQPVIVSLLIDGVGRIEDINIAANVMTSAYGRENYNDYMGRNVKAGNVVYDTRKEPHGSKLRLLGSEVAPKGNELPLFDNIISQNNENDNKNLEKKFSLKDMSVNNETAKYTPERLQIILDRYGSKSNANYSKAYVAYMSPDDFLSLTTSNLAQIERESRELNLEDLQNETQDIFLRFNVDDKEVTGHEGRHRMVALRNAGIKKVPVVLQQDGEKDKYNKIFMKALKLAGEDFGSTKAPGYVEIENLVPASRSFEEYLKRDFVDSEGGSNIRFQLKDQSKDIERLKEANARLKEQFKLTKGVKLDKSAVKKLSRSILKDYGSSYSRGELESRMYNLYDKIANNEIEFEDMQAETQSIARDILENVSVLNDTFSKEYAELRSTLRNTAITLGDKYKSDFDAYGGFDAFRKKNFGRMNLTNDGMQVDSFYQELSEMYPELFLKDIANPSDQLMLINDVLDGLMPIYENPFDRDMNTAVEYLAAEIFEDITDVPQAKPTYADKQKAKLDTVKAENRERIRQVVEQQKAKRDKAVADIKKRYENEQYKTWWKNALKQNDIRSHYQQMIKDLRNQKNQKIGETASRYRERIGRIYEDRKMREVKTSIARRVKRLDTLLRKPTQKKHINKALEKSIAKLLAQLDFTTDRQGENTVLRLRDLRAEYEKIAKVSDEEGMEANADPYIMEALEMLNGKRIADMNLEELEIMYNIVAYFDHMVNSYNKAFIGGKWEEVSNNSYKILDELKTDKPTIESAYDHIQGATDIMKWGMLTPQMFFRRMGNTFTRLYKDIRAAEDKKIVYTKITQDYMVDLLKNVSGKGFKQGINDLIAGKDMTESFSGELAKWTGNNAELKTFKLENGKTIELKPSQVMSLYLLVKREQARGHIFGLGIKAAPIITKYYDKENGENGKKTFKKRVARQFEPVKVTVTDVQKMLATLSKDQKKVADGISKFLNTYTKQWVNEATLQNYGYELAKEENYFPIRSDEDFIKSDFDVANFEASFKSMPFTKPVIKKAGNAIIIDDIFDTFTYHANSAATYGAFLTSVENMKKVINYKTQETSIILAMRKKFGSPAVNYLRKLMSDLQGGIRVEPAPGFLNQLVRWRKRAVLGLNPRTILQQPASIVRATALIDPKYITKGIFQKGDMEEMLKYSPIAWWKSQGYFDIDTGRTMKDIFLGKEPILNKQYTFIQKADNATWTKIWNAVKLEIEDTKPKLKVGSEEYFEAVSERFSEIIDTTQTVDSVLHRSDIMRRTDWSWKMATNFMSEQTVQYNLLLNAAETYKNNSNAANAKKVGRIVAASIANVLTYTFVASMVDAFIDKDDEEFWKIWLDNIISDPIGMIPWIREFDSVFLFGNRRMEYESLVRFGNTMKKFGDWANEWMEGKKHKNPLRLIIKDIIVNGAEIPGVSTRNVDKYVEAVMRRYMEYTGDDKGHISDVYDYLYEK